MVSMSNFCNLHVHSAKGSLLDSMLKVDDIVSFAKKNNQKAIAITDHGYMSSFVDFVKECSKQNIKPIIGNEVYEVDDMNKKDFSKKDREQRYHLILLARNKKGLLNLFQITSKSCTDGFYVKPRIDLKYIKENNLGEGIICLTACQAGRLSKLLVDDNEEDAYTYITKLKDIFDYVACELQSHGTQEQYYANKKIVSFAEKYNFPYCITCDAHMLEKSDFDAHSVFVEISQNREVGETYVGCYLQTEKDIYSTLNDNLSRKQISKGVEETNHIQEMIEIIDIGLNNENQMPIIETPKQFKSNFEYLRNLVFSTFEEKFGQLSEQQKEKRRERLEAELPILKELGYTDYFIMLYMLAKESKKRAIPTGYSRGSGANCLCLFMLNVTQIDSVRWNLDFSRFANLGRKSPADFDYDVSKRRRKEFIEISEYLFGKQNVAPICTFNTLSTKVAIRDIGKIMNEKVDSPYYQQIPYTLRDEVAKMIPTIKTLNDLGEEEEKEMLLKDILDGNSKLKGIYEKFPLWFKYVMKLEGLPKSMGRHAAGTLITPKNINYYCPICYDSDKNIITQIEMHNAMDDLHLVKMDFLGLETLDIIDDTLKMSGLTWQDVDINHIDLDDKEVYEKIYQSGNTIGVFQMESVEAKKMCMQAKANNIEDVIVVNAANRPGTKDSFPDYCNNKLNPKNINVVHEDLTELFKQSCSVLLYQEQALSLLRYAGFPEEEVETGRRAISKKIEKDMKKLKPRFESGLTEKGWSKEQIENIWELLLKQSTYCFNLGHAVAYGLLSYLTAYLKTHYTIYFMTALLSSKSDKPEKIGVIINDCNRMGIKVLPPNINKSSVDFMPIKEKNQILFGLYAIKGIGMNMVNHIIESRPYSSFDDFVEKVNDKSAIIALIKSGAIPVRSKREGLLRYANKLYQTREYQPVKTLPTKYKLLSEWNINTDDYKIGKKVDKERVLKDYNFLKKEKYDREQQNQINEKIKSFEEKYMKDEFLWEFQTLSMFLTNDPLSQSYNVVENKWEKTENGDPVVVLSIIIDIKRKKDKKGKQFAYLDLYTPDGVIEGIIWHSQLKEYSHLILKGACIAILGRKEDKKIIIKEVKKYSEWLNEVSNRKRGVNERTVSRKSG